MEDIVLIEYLKKEKGEIKEVQKDEWTDIYELFFSNFKEVASKMNKHEKDNFINRLKDYNTDIPEVIEHFDKETANMVVSKMWHIDLDNNKCMGEMISYNKAKLIHSEYTGLINESITCWDVYVAVNAQYHDYGKLFKNWFGEYFEAKIIHSAMVFWFEDEDANVSKLWKYFH